MSENEEPKKIEQAITQVSEQTSPPVAPLTREELTAKVEELSARARAAGMSPLQTMIASYAKRGMTMLDTFLSALEDSNSTKKPSDTEVPDATKKER